MKHELNILENPWQNFCTYLIEKYGINTSLTTQDVNKELHHYNACVTDLGEWRVYFTTAEDLIMFKLRWA